MPELAPTQIAILQRLVSQGFVPVAFPLYAQAIGIRRGSVAALLVPDETGGLKILGEPCYLIDGNLGARIRRHGRPFFVWKKKEVEATPALLAEIARFSEELVQVFSSPP